MGDLSENFSESEFKCSCGCDKVIVSPMLVEFLQRLRDRVGVAISITSGYRCEEHNRNVGGKPNSAHRDGVAVDIYCKGSGHRYLLLKNAYSVGFERVGVGSTFLHLDVSDRTMLNFPASHLSHAPANMPVYSCVPLGHVETVKLHDADPITLARPTSHISHGSDPDA